VAGYVSFVSQRSPADLRDIASVSVGDQLAASDYEPHPILNQLTSIIPTNPLEALSNPDGNRALQVAFLAVIVGILLSVIGEEQRKRASQGLKSALALIVKDTDLKWHALSDWADLLRLWACSL
jgi:Na+/H+-dicarboxylate symporter